MIYAELFDCGTTFVKYPWNDVPGMDQGYYRELDMEHYWPSERTDEIRDAILAVPNRVDYEPWPQQLSGYLWIDWHKSYWGDVGGPQIKLWHYDFWADESHPVPAAVTMTQDRRQPPWPQYGGVNESIEPLDRRSARTKTQDEINDNLEVPTDDKWIRLPLINEIEQPQLTDPVIIKQGNHQGTAYLPSVNYGSCFQGVDLTKGVDWYNFIDDDGNEMSAEEGMERSYLRDNATYRLYLAPAKWRMTCFVLAHYWYASYTESYGVPLQFVKAFYTRPSVYPVRHDVNHTKDQTVITWLDTDYSFDDGVNSAFDRSRGSLDLRQEIIDQQWWTLSEAFIFIFNDPVLMALWQHPPDPGDIVLGIGRVDYGGNESRHWVVQKKDINHIWPREVIGLFFTPWSVL